MKALLIISLGLLMSLTFVSAAEGIDISIVDNQISIRGYTESSFAGKIPADFIPQINESLGSGVVCHNNVTVQETQGNSTVNVVYPTNCTLALSYTKTLPFGFNVTNVVVGDQKIQQDFIACIAEREQHKAGLNNCNKALVEQGEWESNFSTCNTNLVTCQAERSTAISDKNRFEQEQEQNKNSGWTWAIGGLAVGVLGSLWYTGKIGGPKQKKPEDSYNPQQAA
jgi:hypothetical protein